MKICIVAHNGYAQISGRPGHIGGVELQTAMLAKWLAACGHDTTYVTWDEGGGQQECFDGVSCLKVCAKDAGIPGLRFLYPRWTSLVAVLEQADADVYYHNGAEYVTGQVALWCRQNNRRFVFCAASDTDCDETLPDLGSFRERFLYRLGLRAAQRIAVQTNAQKLMLQKWCDGTIEVLPMPCAGAQALPRSDRENLVIFVARISREKRVEWVLQIAAMLPDVRFLILGDNPDDTDYVATLTEAAAGVSNVSFFGRANRAELWQFYARASLLVCTSTHEGFPNTFLEAFSFGIPVLSTVDPDGIVRRQGLGRIVADVTEAVRGISELSLESVEWAESSQRAREYYAAHHSAERALPRFEALLTQ